MTDILKEKIVIRTIKVYKNREEWTDDYVQERYSDAIEYMIENFDKFFSNSSISGGSSSSSAPTGSRVTKIKQGEREINYEYGDSSTTTTSGLNSKIMDDIILIALLGYPLIKVM